MKIFYIKAFQNIALVILMALFSNTAFSGLTALDDSELSEISGQASLIGIDRYDYAGNNFYQIKVNSVVQTSVNIDHLILRDGGGAAQIDIENFSLNGGDDGNNNSEVSSGTLTNPFVEFAFSGTLDNANARDREIIGIRVGADNIDATLSFGEQDQSGTADTGINMFHGYMETSRITGRATTLDSSAAEDLTPNDGVNPASWATANETNLANVAVSRGPFTVSGRANVFYNCQGFGCIFSGAVHLAVAAAITNAPFTSNDIQMRFPSVESDLFDIDGIVINTNAGAISSQDIDVEGITIPELFFSATGSTSVNAAGFIPIGINLLSPGSITNGLLINSTVTEDLRFIHRAKVDGGSFYISAQNSALRWRGAPTDDIAQPGWWMSIEEPVQLGELALNNVYLDDTVLGEVTDRISDYITDNVVQIGSTEALEGLGGTTSAPLGGLDITGAAPVTLNLSNISLGAVQQEIRNCWNGALGC